MKKTLSIFSALVAWAIVLYGGPHSTDPRAMLDLVAPHFTAAPGPYYENNILFGISNPNADSETEIYRSLSASSGYQLIATIPASEIAYYDADLSPRTTFYYKLRAVSESEVSPFSASTDYTSGSKFYNPGLTAMALDARRIQLIITDNSYDDVEYRVYRDVGPATGYITSVVATDSGQTFVFVDQGLVPNTYYHYRIDARTQGANNPLRQGVAQASATTPEDTTLMVPEFSHQAPPEFFCESVINFEFFNPNPGSLTEIYRSLQPETGFEKIATSGTSYFVDDVAPHTTYYYKLRAIKNGQASEFSAPEAFTSLSDFYNPTLTADPSAAGITLALTDNTFADISYGIIRNEVGTDNWTDIGATRIQLPDSGQTYHYVDTAVIAGVTYAYYIDVIVNCDGFPQYYEVASDTATAEATLSAPYFTNLPPSVEPCGNQVAFVYDNPNPGSITEIYRSLYPDTGFVLIGTQSAGVNTYLDTKLGSKTKYYYKLRAVKDSTASPYSQTQALMSGAAFFDPLLTATALPDNTVQLTFQDRSYLDFSYEIYGVEAGTTDVTLNTGVSALDSGSVHTFIDSLVVPGKTYIYYVNVILDINCGGQYLTNVVMDTITVPNAPYISGFTLVDTRMDIDIRELHDYDTINATDKPSIRANANKITSSVGFYLNGKKINTDNTPPYVIYGDAHGNYNPGKLKPGDYTFTAIPYTANNAGGIAGQPRTIHFTVYNDAPHAIALRDIEDEAPKGVRFYPNPLVSRSTLEIMDVPESKVKIEILDHQGNGLTTLFTGRLDERGYLLQVLDREQFKRGTYLIAVTINGQTTVRRIAVE